MIVEPTRRFPLALTLMLAGLILLVAIALTGSAQAAPVPRPPDQDVPSNDYCIGCHTQQGMSRRLDDGSVLPLTINGTRFTESVHGQEVALDR